MRAAICVLEPGSGSVADGGGSGRVGGLWSGQAPKRIPHPSAVKTRCKPDSARRPSPPFQRLRELA
jgi:hypothetical protein